MAAETGIAWTEATWNPWVGCAKVSAGCKHCYMFAEQARYGQDPTVVRRTSNHTFNLPRRLHKLALKAGRGGLVFTCSWSDWFLPAADAWRPDAWEMVRASPCLTFQVLTKRPELMHERLPPTWGEGWPNVWLGTSIESRRVLHRIDVLRATPAALRFLSIEPLLESVGPVLDLRGIGWVIVGGESGSESRTCDELWIREVIDACKAQGVPCFVKQLGSEFVPSEPGAGPRARKGDDPSEWPEALRVREFPPTRWAKQ